MTNADRLRAMAEGARITGEDLIQAANEIDELKKALRALTPCDEVKEFIGVVLYFQNREDAGEFMEMVRQSQPNLKPFELP